MRILMTGCSRSLGAYLRNKLMEQGHSVYGVGQGGPDFEYDFLDHTGDGPMAEGQVDMIFMDAEDKLDGPIDILVNNAGITEIEYIENHAIEDFCNVLWVNLMMPFLFTQKMVERMKNTPPEHPLDLHPLKRIVNTTSMGAHIGLRASPGYCASKSGLESLSRVVAKECAGVIPLMTICVALGSVGETFMIEQVVDEMVRTRGITEEDAKKYIMAGTPLGRNMRFDEVWDMYDFAINHAPEYMSGTVLKCPGGSGL